MRSIFERLNEFISTKRFTNRSFALTVNMNVGTIGQQLSGSRSLSLETINATLSTFPDLSAEWLLRGTGSMMLSHSSSPSSVSIDNKDVGFISNEGTCFIGNESAGNPQRTPRPYSSQPCDTSVCTASEPQHDYYESRLRIKQERIEALECELARLRQA